MRIWRLTAPVKSRKVQLEVMHSSKQSDFERDFEVKTSMLKVVSKENDACSKVLSKGSYAQFETERFGKGFRSKNKHGRESFRRKKKHARAVISSAQWLQSTLEQ